MRFISRFSSSTAALAWALVVVVANIGAGGCVSFNSARPLAPGEHAVAVTAGGPLTTIPGVGVIPLPNVTVEGRHGVVEHLDVNYGVHLLPTIFGALGGHVGGTLSLWDQPQPLIPVVAVGQRFFFFTNIFDPRKPIKDAYALSQTDLTASWEIQGSLVYAGASAYIPIDLEDRTLHLRRFSASRSTPASIGCACRSRPAGCRRRPTNARPS